MKTELKDLNKGIIFEKNANFLQKMLTSKFRGFGTKRYIF